MTYDPRAAHTHSIKWYIGSEHEQTAPDRDTDDVIYQYDTKGWPYFIGIKETRVGFGDYHIAGGIQSLQTAQRIVRLHNAQLST